VAIILICNTVIYDQMSNNALTALSTPSESVPTASRRRIGASDIELAAGTCA
jgi:hypothetical protein